MFSNERVKIMAHNLHRFLRDLRFENGELLKNMADKLNLGSAELSSIEHGKKPVPEGFLDKIQKIYFAKGYECKCPRCGSENIQIYSYMENEKVFRDIICGDCE